MSEHRPIYKKGSLLYATIVALACVMTAGVSTFAWFQAEANVRVSATNSSTTITVVNNLNITLTASLKYYTGTYTDGVGIGYTGSPAMLYSDFLDADLSHRSLSNLHAGYKMTFLVEVVATGGNMGSVYLTMTGMNSTNAGTSSNRFDVTDGDELDKPIVLANAINIYSGYVEDTSSVSIGGTDKFVFSSSSVSDYELVAQTSGVGDVAYLYYTVEFSATDSLYTEYRQAAATDILFPAPSSLGSERYFKQDPSYGNSNCYDGLSFSVPSLIVSCSRIVS